MYRLEDFKVGDKYMDGNGDYISEEEAQEEVEWLNNLDWIKKLEVEE